MAFTVGATLAKDSEGDAIPGGLLSADIAGGGVGPTFFYHGVVDGLAGENKLEVTSANAMKAVLVAGTAAFGKLAANSGVDIGDVDVTSVPADPFGANADAASATGSISAKLRFIAATGIPITGTVTVASHAVTNAGTFAVQAAIADGADVTLGAKADAKSASTDTTAVTLMQVSKQISFSMQAAAASLAGTLTVGSHAVTNAGTFAVQETGSWVQVDDAAFTQGTSKIAVVGATFDDTSPDSIDEGDGGAIRMSANRNLYVRIRDNAGNERGLNVDASGQIAVTLASAQTLATLTSITNVVHVDDNSGSLTVDNGGTFAVQPAGSAAHDAVASANPVLTGGYASLARPSAVSGDGDAVNSWVTRYGAQATVPAYGSKGVVTLQSNSTGTTYNAFSSQACLQATLINDTGVDLEVRFDGAGSTFILWSGASFTVLGIANVSEIGYRRKDTSNTQVTLAAVWNS